MLSNTLLLSRLEVSYAAVENLVDANRLKARNGGRQLLPATPSQRRYAHSVEVAAGVLVRCVKIGMRVKPDQAGFSISEAGVNTDRGIAVSSKHDGEEPRPDRTRNGMGDAPLQLKAATDIAFKPDGRRDCLHLRSNAVFYDCSFNAVLQKLSRPVADTFVRDAGVVWNNDKADVANGGVSQSQR